MSARTALDRFAPMALLSAGGVLVVLSFMRFSLPACAWVAFAPFLVFLHERATPGRHLALLAALVVSFLAAVGKMATSEIGWWPVPMFAVPMALSYFAAVAFAAAAHRRLGARWGVYTFGAAAVALGWMQYTFTPDSSWGALAHTQLHTLPLVQLAALTGIGGVTFLVASGSGLAAAMGSAGVKAVRVDAVVVAALIGCALIYGEWRLARPAPGRIVRIGAVVSPVAHADFRGAYADLDTLRPRDDELFARTERAVDRGAEVVVWNEVATLVHENDEAALASRGQSLASRRGVFLMMAYGVVDSVHPFHFVNKYRVYLPDGTMADDYVKRHPVPGDPNTRSTTHARAVPFAGVRFAGGICYDYGFPEIARDNARDGADVALVPASDWRGIDPEHGRMAVMNAVAVGLPMVRPVRAATSIATDSFGRLLATLPAEGDDGVMVAAVPSERVPTTYARTGELMPIACLAFCALVAARVWLKGKA